MRFILSCLIILRTISVYGQADSAELILTKEQNENWFIHLGQSDLKEQVESINKRILIDTNVSVFSGIDRHVAEHLSNKRAGYCKPIIVAGGVPIYIENKTKTIYLERLTELLKPKSIKAIEIMSGDKAMAIFGSRGECNVIVMTVKRKSTAKRIAKLDKEMHPKVVRQGAKWRH